MSSENNQCERLADHPLALTTGIHGRLAGLLAAVVVAADEVRVQEREANPAQWRVT